MRTGKAFELRYVIAGAEPAPVGEDDPEAVREATSKTCRKIHALLVADGPADSRTLAEKLGSDRTMLGKRLTRLVNAGFATVEMTTTPGRQGRSFIYTATTKPMPDPEARWSDTRRRVYDALAELGEAGLTALSNHAGLDRNVATQHIRRLVSDGYFERIPGKTGMGRRGTYRITDKPQPAHVVNSTR